MTTICKTRCDTKGCAAYKRAIPLPFDNEVIIGVEYGTIALWDRVPPTYRNGLRVEARRGHPLGRIYCRTCNGPTELIRIKATTSRTECGPRCTSARGPSCDCKCEGRNHGAA